MPRIYGLLRTIRPCLPPLLLFIYFKCHLTRQQTVKTERDHEVEHLNLASVKENSNSNISSICTSLRIITDSNLRYSCRYLAGGIRNDFFLTDELESGKLELLHFTITPPQCQRIEFLILINSAPGNSAKRDVIRKTWKPEIEKNGTVLVYFVTGETMEGNISKDLHKEAKKLKDVIILQLLDGYNKITIKHFMMYRWLRDNCESAKFFMKGDDDIVVNPFMYDEFITQISSEKELSLHGKVARSLSPIREAGNWAMPTDVHPLQHYPSYPSGFVYIQSRSAAMKIMDVLPLLPITGIDDLLIGGFAATLAGVKQVDDSRILLGSPKFGEAEQLKPAFSWMAGGPDKIEEDWKKLLVLYNRTNQ